MNNLPAPLCDAEEFELFSSKKPDRDEQLILHALRSALDLTRKLCRNRFPADEQFSIAGDCLMRAMKTFNPKKVGERLDIFVRPFLRGAVAQAWRDREPVAYGEKIPEKPDPLNPPQPLERDVIEQDFQSLDFKERWAVVQPFLAGLTEPERRILMLHYETGLSFADIGEMQNVSRAAIHQTHFQALKKLRHALMDSGVWKNLTE